MYEERTGKCLGQVEHIRGHLWHRYSIMVNQVMLATSTLPKGTLGSVASLLAATPYQGNPDRIHKLNWEIYTPYAGAAGMLLHINGKFTMEILNHLFCRKVSFLIAPHCQFWGVGQGMKQTYLYLWYPLFQVQWDRCNQPNHQT